MAYKLGVTTGLHYVARSEELATVVKKLGFGITRGVSSIEVALDVPHEVTDTDGIVLRKIAQKQGVDILMHGSLTIPMGIPERSDWRDAQDHIEKSIRSSVKAGAKYVDFHACLNIWLELMTYTSRKLTMSFCDHKGRFISHILEKSPKLREWFVRERGDYYYGDILSKKQNIDWQSKANNKIDKWQKDEIQEKLSSLGINEAYIKEAMQLGRLPTIDVTRQEQEEIFKKYTTNGQITPENQKKAQAEIETLMHQRKELTDKGREEMEDITKQSIVMRSQFQDEEMKKAITKKLEAGERWESEELRASVGILDGYHIMAHYMFYEKDPMWERMASVYDKELGKYNMDYNDDNWLHDAWRKAEMNNDRGFKEFFYGAVAAKFLEGHLAKALEWMYGHDPDNNMRQEPWFAKNKLFEKYANELIMAIEMPDARDPQHAGLHLLWSTKQVYIAVKVIREVLKTNQVWMLCDFEHVATQGLDPVVDLEQNLKYMPDLGKITISIHANAPNPSHAHEPLELGDIRVYKMLYYLVKTGFGKNGKDVFVIYERGGGEDPFQRSVEALRLMLKFVDPGASPKNPVRPDKLPPEFFGYKGAVAGDETRQLQIIREHAYEPLKDLLELPDEEFGMLSRTIVSKGKRPEQWKKGEFR